MCVVADVLDEKNELWQRWRARRKIGPIARHCIAARVRSMDTSAVRAASRPGRAGAHACALTTTEREEISRQLARGGSLRAIGRALDREPSTISRESRAQSRTSDYRAAPAIAGMATDAERPKPCRLSLRRTLGASWRRNSPFSGRHSKSQAGFDVHFRHPEMQVSHETIYRSLFIQSRGVLKRALRSHLRRQRQFRMRGRALRLRPTRTDHRRHLHSAAACGGRGSRPAGHWR